MISRLLLASLLLLLSYGLSYGGSTMVEPHIKQYYQASDFSAVGTSGVMDMKKYPSSNISVQITADGTVTSFDVDIETTLDCDTASTFTAIPALNLASAQADAINDIKSAIGYPARCARINVTDLTLGTATKITVYLLILRDS